MSQSITAEELKQIKDQQTELGQVVNQIGQLEANKHALSSSKSNRSIRS